MFFRVDSFVTASSQGKPWFFAYIIYNRLGGEVHNEKKKTHHKCEQIYVGSNRLQQLAAIVIS